MLRRTGTSRRADELAKRVKMVFHIFRMLPPGKIRYFYTVPDPIYF